MIVGTAAAEKKTASAFRATFGKKAGTMERRKIGRKSPAFATVFENSARMRCRHCHRRSKRTYFSIV